LLLKKLRVDLFVSLTQNDPIVSIIIESPNELRCSSLPFHCIAFHQIPSPLLPFFQAHLPLFQCMFGLLRQSAKIRCSDRKLRHVAGPTIYSNAAVAVVVEMIGFRQ